MKYYLVRTVPTVFTNLRGNCPLPVKRFQSKVVHLNSLLHGWKQSVNFLSAFFSSPRIVVMLIFLIYAGVQPGGFQRAREYCSIGSQDKESMENIVGNLTPT